ncbi:hypothetical protein Shyd_00150 [Streptomyces hydrogenans]|uniref:Pentapeptide repeat-containing protein n=1 Tax=Streptomyces hydrogenans TaxID=1873719 RepID=A0ABQ3P0U3_9ACTN|nr:pentapeptide repeat-containing protein [Streptomyces hydrogenans]GHI18644.1 hypothetical protein Shyd_00150 [Streptomyces hydrogenans]
MSTPPPPTPSTEAPSWPHCAHGADPVTNPVGCRGIHVPGHTACLAHLNDTDRTAYLTGLAPGADIDHRGTPFTETLLDQLLIALTDLTTPHPHFGTAEFREAQFSGDARFDWARFSRDARFQKAQFSGIAGFDSARFSRDARFQKAQFSGVARFGGARFFGVAWFGKAQFSGDARFDEAQFSSIAWFRRTQFSRVTRFEEAQFSGNAEFREAQFLTSDRWGPLVCKERVDLSGAVFGAPVTLEIAADRVSCVRTRWESTATVRVRRAEVDLGYAVWTAPVALTAHPVPFTDRGGVACGREPADRPRPVCGSPRCRAWTPRIWS